MSDDLDPRLVELLRRGPPPPAALDSARRAAILVEARQAWFRAQARRRRAAWTTAAAACLVAGAAGWGIRALAEPAISSAHAPVTATRPRPETLAENQPYRGANRIPAGTAEFGANAAGVAAPMASEQRLVLRDEPPEEMPPRPAAMAAAPAAAAPVAAVIEAGVQAVAARRKAEDKDEKQDAAAMPGKQLAPPAPTLAAKAVRSAAPAIQVPAAAPERGRLLTAAAVVHAAQQHALQPGDRVQALSAALDLIAGIQHPAADAIRKAIATELQRR